MQKPTYLTSVEKIEELNDEQITEMKKVTDVYPFRANDYYLGLINWNDPHDPIKRIILPDFEELDEWGGSGYFTGA